MRGILASRPQRQRREYFGELDAYRSFAALLIVIHHGYLFVRGGAGDYLYSGTPLHLILANLDIAVSWFFALSGFLLFLPFASAAIDRTASPSLMLFLSRRAIRILPLYYVVLLVIVLAGLGKAGGRDDLLRHLTFTHVFDAHSFYGGFDVAWSLGVEVAFYLFLAVFGPVVVRGCAPLADRRARIAVLLTALLAVASLSAAYKWWGLHTVGITIATPQLYFGPVSQLDTFAAGMAVAVAYAASDGHGLLDRRPRVMLAAGGLLLLALAVLFRQIASITWVYCFTITGGAFALILAATVLGPGTSALRRSLHHPVLQLLGLGSYSLYLWHRPLLDALSATPLHTTVLLFPAQLFAFVMVAVTVAWLSYCCIERPALRLRRLISRASTVQGSTVAAGLADGVVAGRR